MEFFLSVLHMWTILQNNSPVCREQSLLCIGLMAISDFQEIYLFRTTQHVDDISEVQSLLSTSFQLASFDPILIFVVTYSNIPQTSYGSHLINVHI